MRILRTMLLVMLTLSLALTATADVKDLARKAKAALRAGENTNDQAVLKAKLDEAKELIDQIRAEDPNFVELGAIQARYRSLSGGLKARQDQEAREQAQASIDWNQVRQVIADWEALIKMTKDLRQKTKDFFPNDQNIAYTKEQTDQVLALAADVLKNDQPRILAFLKEFEAKYGPPGDETDRKIIALTPKDPKKGMYDEANQRPSDLPSRCHQELVDRLTWVRENPKLEARKIMKTVSDLMAHIDFIMDTQRDQRYAESEAEIQRALRFAPGDPEITKYLADLRAGRRKSQADIKKALESARFPAAFAGFAGPGTPANLAAQATSYFNANYPKEKVLKVAVAGNWFVAKQNIFGEPIQWGLPVYVASQQDEPGVCRVFKSSVLTAVGLKVAKAPPFTDHWTGDSYRMLVSNLK